MKRSLSPFVAVACCALTIPEASASILLVDNKAGSLAQNAKLQTALSAGASGRMCHF